MKQPNLFKSSISDKQMADAVKTLGTSMEIIIVSLQKVVHSMKQMKQMKKK